MFVRRLTVRISSLLVLSQPMLSSNQQTPSPLWPHPLTTPTKVPPTFWRPLCHLFLSSAGQWQPSVRVQSHWGWWGVTRSSHAGEESWWTTLSSSVTRSWLPSWRNRHSAFLRECIASLIYVPLILNGLAHIMGNNRCCCKLDCAIVHWSGHGCVFLW